MRPMRPPSGSIMVWPRQVRTVSMSAMTIVPPCRRHPAGDRLPVPAASAATLVVDVDLLLADLLGDLLLAGHGVLLQANPLSRHGPLLHHRLLLVEGHLVLGLGDVRTGHGGADVGVGDRLALDPRLLALHRHGLGNLLGGDVLAQPHPAPLAGLGADLELL